jgi:hypothetical protein
MFVIDTFLLYYTLTYLMYFIMLQLSVYFTVDGGFQAFLCVLYEVVKQVIPLYGCKHNNGAIHKTTNLAISRSSVSESYTTYNHLIREMYYKKVHQLL